METKPHEWLFDNSHVVMQKIFKPLYQELQAGRFVNDTIEIIAPRIELNPFEPFLSLPGKESNKKYIKKELEWYNSMDLNVEDIEWRDSIWSHIKNRYNEVNSNYGWCIHHKDNGLQFEHAVQELHMNPTSRRACMIYNRPSMHVDCKRDGMDDFICTFATQQLIRDGKLIYIVYMRSNDAIFGFFNDFAWHCHVYQEILKRLVIPDPQNGQIIWVSGSFHAYKKHYPIVQNMF